MINISELLGEYTNGNYKVAIFRDGTKIRETPEDDFIPCFPESIDVKITNRCDLKCPFCHEQSVEDGAHGKILEAEFINTLRPYTEIAIGGGNPLSHPLLIDFLEVLKDRKVIANMTVNQKHFIDGQPVIEWLVDRELIHGLGISLAEPTAKLLAQVKRYPNAVFHVINGVVSMEDLQELYDQNFKILILGYKKFGRGDAYYTNGVELRKTALYNELPSILKHFKVVSFDNLAIEQLDCKRLMGNKRWDEFYMGDDGQYTMYVDLVKNEFASSSVSTARRRLLNNIEDMFNIVRSE